MKKQYAYAAVSIFLWSTTATVTKLLLGNLNSMQVTLASSFFAVIFLFLLNLKKGTLKELKTYKLSDYIKIFLLGALGIFLYHLLLFLGIDTLDASQAFIINYLWPMMAVVFACIILKEKMTIKKLAAVFLSFLGVVMVTGNGNFMSVDQKSIIGAAFCILAAISYGLFTVLNKKATYNKYLSMMLYYLSSLVISLLYTFFAKDWFTLSLAESIGMLWSGVFTTAIAFTSWALALDCGDTAKVSNLAYITPFLSLVWTSVFLKEEITIYSILGLCIIVLGIFVQVADGKKVFAVKQK